MSSPDPRDLTPESASPTDVAPLGRTGEKPAHERTADEDRADADWEAIAAHDDFKKLLASLQPKPKAQAKTRELAPPPREKK